MRSINPLFPLRHGSLQSRLLLTLAHQLTERTTPINRVVSAIDALFGTRLTFLAAEGRRGELIECEGVRVDDDTVVFRRAFGGDEAAMDFLGYALGWTGQGIAEAAAAPSYPF